MTGTEGKIPTNSERAIQKQKFAELFGVTEEELEAKGVDPGEYARTHIHEAMKDRRNWDRLGLSRAAQAEMQWPVWGWRGFVAMFVGMGFLFLSKLRPLHWLGIAGATLMLLLALVMYVIMLIYRHRSRLDV